MSVEKGDFDSIKEACIHELFAARIHDGIVGMSTNPSPEVDITVVHRSEQRDLPDRQSSGYYKPTRSGGFTRFPKAPGVCMNTTEAV